VHAPTGRSGPLPLVVDLHGYSEPNNVHALMTAMEAKGDVAGFVTVTPVITRTVPRWDTALDGPDMAFLSGLLDHVEATRCIDLARVYVSGLSNGAFMSSAVACALADRVAAVAPVAGLQLPDGCHPARPMPIISFHGTADRYVAYTGGLGPAVADLPSPDGAGTLGTGVLNASGGGPSVPDTEAAWARLDGCDATPETAKIADDVTLVHHHCPGGVDVELYSIDGGGHTWPGSEFSRTIEQIVGHTTFSVSATELIWQFFADHPRRNG
jgi:polyhydroxybutyrate depolymerase